MIAWGKRDEASVCMFDIIASIWIQLSNSDRNKYLLDHFFTDTYKASQHAHYVEGIQTSWDCDRNRSFFLSFLRPLSISSHSHLGPFSIETYLLFLCFIRQKNQDVIIVRCHCQLIGDSEWKRKKRLSLTQMPRTTVSVSHLDFNRRIRRMQVTYLSFVDVWMCVLLMGEMNFVQLCSFWTNTCFISSFFLTIPVRYVDCFIIKQMWLSKKWCSLNFSQCLHALADTAGKRKKEVNVCCSASDLLSQRNHRRNG